MNTIPASIVPERVQGAIIGVVGLIVIGLSIYVGFLKSTFLDSAQRAEGTVTALEAGTSHVRVEFTDQNGEHIVFPGNGWISHRVGERVPVVYSGENPIATAQLDEPGSVWSGTASLAVIGAGMVLTCAYTLLKRQK